MQLVLLAASVTGDVDTFLDDLRLRFLNVAQTVGKRITEKQTSALGEIRKILAEANDDRFVYLRYNDLANETIVSAPENLTVPPDIEGVFLGGLRRSAESLSDRSKPGPQGTAVATPVVLPGKQPRASIVLTAPVVAGGGFRGVLSAVVDFQPLWDDMLRRRRTGHAVFILDEKGGLFAARGGSGMPLPEEFLHSDLVKLSSWCGSSAHAG